MPASAAQPGQGLLDEPRFAAATLLLSRVRSACEVRVEEGADLGERLLGLGVHAVTTSARPRCRISGRLGLPCSVRGCGPPAGCRGRRRPGCSERRSGGAGKHRRITLTRVVQTPSVLSPSPPGSRTWPFPGASPGPADVAARRKLRNTRGAGGSGFAVATTSCRRFAPPRGDAGTVSVGRWRRAG